MNKLFLGIISTVFQITEIFEFLSRLTIDHLYDEGSKITISLHNAKDRSLWVDGARRAPLFGEYKSSSDVPSFEKIYEPKQIIDSPKDLALEAIRYFFEIFRWDDANVEQIKKDQQSLINRDLSNI